MSVFPLASGLPMRTAAFCCSLLLASMAAGCATRAAPHARLAEPWTFEPEVTKGEVRVLPVLPLHGELAVDVDSFVGVPVPYERQVIRAERTEAIEAVPAVVGERLPGAVNGLLGERWHGQFRHGLWPLGSQDKLRKALEVDPSSVEVDDLLGELAEGIGTNATLITWVREIDGLPVSKQGFPGTTVDTPVGAVLVNHADEPYVVTVKVGLALVSGQGEVLIRYEHDYQTLLSSTHDTHDAGGDLARRVAEDVTKVWATEAELAPVKGLLALQE